MTLNQERFGGCGAPCPLMFHYSINNLFDLLNLWDHFQKKMLPDLHMWDFLCNFAADLTYIQCMTVSAKAELKGNPV